MKKLLLSFILITAMFAANAQVLLYEGFNYTVPGTIGGNGAAGTSSNGWTTHNVTTGQTTTIDLASGNLSYTGLASPSGNMVYFFSAGNTVSRDVNAPFTTSATSVYYSALVNIIDSSQISSSNYDYFMAFGSTAGTAVTGYGGRLGIKATSAAKTNFRFAVLNTSGGTNPPYTENAVDLNFGTTYLVVMKLDVSTVPVTATLWVNPTTLGGSEPSGSVSNNVGTTAMTTIASICLRNNAVSPKANIDEIRVGLTFADVTPLTTGINENTTLSNISLYPNPAVNSITVRANENLSQVQIFDVQGKLVMEYDFNGTSEIKLNVAELPKGLYNIVANSTNGKVYGSKFVK